MRLRGRVDANQGAIVDALRKCGATVEPVSSLGHGCPDIAVGFRRQNYFFEIKDPRKPPSARQLTADELLWHHLWQGQVAVIETESEALHYIGLLSSSS